MISPDWVNPPFFKPFDHLWAAKLADLNLRQHSVKTLRGRKLRQFQAV
jgi:hypothetical protein